MRNNTLYLFGASGHAKVILDSLEQTSRFHIRGLLDDDTTLWSTQVFGYPVLGGRDVLRQEPLPVIVSIGDNRIRSSLCQEFSTSGLAFEQAIHPCASVSRGVLIGAGTVMMAGVVVNADTSIGEHVILNTAASVDHDCIVGHYAHIAPGARICGGVMIGERTLIGAGATVIPNIRIGADVIIGAGATVIHDIPDGAIATGTPAKIMKASE